MFVSNFLKFVSMHVSQYNAKEFNSYEFIALSEN